MTKWSWDPLDAHRQTVQLVCHDDGALGRTLGPIAEGIAAAQDRYTEIEQAAAEGDDIDWLVDESAELIENLLGAVYVVCQARITNVISAVKHLGDYCTKNNVTTKNLVTGKAALLALGRPVSKLAVSEVTALNALANYFKHRDEWSEQVDWTKLTGQSLDTATIIMQLGLKPLSTGNLSTGAAALGNSNSRTVGVFDDAVGAWCGQIVAMVEAAFK